MKGLQKLLLAGIVFISLSGNNDLGKVQEPVSNLEVTSPAKISAPQEMTTGEKLGYGAGVMGVTILANGLMAFGVCYGVYSLNKKYSKKTGN